MKIALLGDIHGNHPALKAVLDAASFRGAECLLINGDFIGYYFRPKEVMDLLATWRYDAVRGNHEDMLVAAQKDIETLNAITSKYGGGLRMALEQLDMTQLEHLSGLPHPLELAIDGCTMLLCHGAPWDAGFYVYPDAPQEILERCAAGGHELVILGHTHYPMLRRVGNVLLVNPGSVGQPRNRKPGAQWALFDTKSRECIHYVEEYDMSSVLEESLQNEPLTAYLREVLTRQ